MNIASRSKIGGVRLVIIMAAGLLLTSLSASSSFAQISEEAMQQCAALSNSMRRLTCFDLLAQLRVTERSDTTGRAAGVMGTPSSGANVGTRCLDRKSTGTKAEPG
jgi:hypothetical protein